jgi:DNA-binding response OmpR family regulator
VEDTVAGGKILVVDDDNVLRASIARILEEEGYTVDDAPEGSAALEKIRRDRPDAILLDVMMPGMNGRQFLDELRGRAGVRDIPVVVMTALQGLGSDRAIDLGANDLVEKPFDVDELLNKVALALFRSGEREPGVDGTGATHRAAADIATGTGGAAPAERAATRPGVALVVSHDTHALAELDAALGARGYTVVCVPRVTDDLPGLARVLQPRGIIFDLRGPDGAGMAAVRRLRDDAGLDRVPILVLCGTGGGVQPSQREIEALAVAADARPMDAARIAEFLAEPPAGARRASG